MLMAFRQQHRDQIRRRDPSQHDQKLPAAAIWALLVGMREGEWFARWEGAIRRAVTNRVQSRTPAAWKLDCRIAPETLSVVPT